MRAACSWVAGNAQPSRHARLGCGARDEVISGCAVGYHSRDLEGWPLRAISFASWANERILCVDRASSPPCAAVDVGSGLWTKNVGTHTFRWRVNTSDTAPRIAILEPGGAVFSKLHASASCMDQNTNDVRIVSQQCELTSVSGFRKVRVW